jgi:hemerythrin superfamily protein
MRVAAARSMALHFVAHWMREVVMATRNESKVRNAVLDMLKQDHRKAKKAFSDFDKLADEEREQCEQIVERTCAELEVHAALEEEIFYPAVRRAI